MVRKIHHNKLFFHIPTMPKRQANIKLDYKHRLIDVNEIDPSPFQVRKFFDDDKQKELAESIKRDGLIEPIVVRRKGRRYEIIAGERRFRAVRDFTEMKNIPAQIVKATDLEARRMSTAENLQREDLSAIETIEAIVEIVDAELIEDKQYAAIGKNPADRVKTLLGKLDSVRRSQERGSSVSKQSKSLSHKFMGQVEKIFKNFPKPLEWRSFYNNDLPILMDISEEVRKVSIQKGLNRSQIRALETLKEVSSEEYQRVTACCQGSPNSVIEPDTRDYSQLDIKDLSAREIEGIAEKAAKKEGLAELNRARVSPSFCLEKVILMMSRLGIPVERIAARLKINRKTAKKYSENLRFIQSIKKSLNKGHACHKVAEEHRCSEPLVWSIALEGKSDLDRFKALNWGLRTWDLWNWNDCDKRFGDDWPGRIPAQMIAHILYYFSDKNDLVFDPMAGGGVVADTCLAFNRKCWSFDMNLKWPIKGKTKPDLIIFDPPYFKKQSNNYDPDGISTDGIYQCRLARFPKHPCQK
ncbi:MAG: hypothetical protein B1H13_03870 [Desulfobacteraceae bacterium 4484_190.3]|nr:MAG: hypothetical protein B1H13_03870 [Desulfobacteraceae bacterium 4484_190.3]